MSSVVCAASYFIHSLSEWDAFEQQSKLSADQIRTLFSKEIGSFTSFRKEWCMKMAKEIALQFNRDLHEYKSVRLAKVFCMVVLLKELYGCLCTSDRDL